MPGNDQHLLKELFRDAKTRRWSALREDVAWEHFAAELVLRHRDLTPDEVADGITGGNGDGGIDAVYTVLGDQLLLEDSSEASRTRAISALMRGTTCSPPCTYRLPAGSAKSF